MFFKKLDSEFSYVEVWFTDQNSNPLEIEYKINIILVVNFKYNIKNDTLFELNNATLFKIKYM